jgi:hypothetical protein
MIKFMENRDISKLTVVERIAWVIEDAAIICFCVESAFQILPMKICETHYAIDFCDPVLPDNEVIKLLNLAVDAIKIHHSTYILENCKTLLEKIKIIAGNDEVKSIQAIDDVIVILANMITNIALQHPDYIRPLMNGIFRRTFEMDSSQAFSDTLLHYNNFSLISSSQARFQVLNTSGWILFSMENFFMSFGIGTKRMLSKKNALLEIQQSVNEICSKHKNIIRKTMADIGHCIVRLEKANSEIEILEIVDYILVNFINLCSVVIEESEDAIERVMNAIYYVIESNEWVKFKRMNNGLEQYGYNLFGMTLASDEPQSPPARKRNRTRSVTANTTTKKTPYSLRSSTTAKSARTKRNRRTGKQRKTRRN